MNDTSPLVCICIPNYNNEKTIEATLNSLVNQTYKKIIIKIFDNASTDKSLEIIKRYTQKYKHIHLYCNQANIGAEGNFNKCFENAEGKYFAIFHSDDIYNKKIVEKEVEYLEANKDCSAVSTASNLIDENGKIIATEIYSPQIISGIEKKFAFNELFSTTLLHHNIVNCPSVMFRTEIVKTHQIRANGNKFKSSSDLDIWFRLSKIGKFGVINQPLLNYRISENSWSYRNRFSLAFYDYFLVIEHYLAELNFKKELDKNIYKFYVSKYNNAALSVNIHKIMQGEIDFVKYKNDFFGTPVSYLYFHFKRLVYFLLSKSYFGLRIIKNKFHYSEQRK